MKQKSANRKTLRRNRPAVDQAPSAGSNGMAAAPPSYGIGAMDHGLSEARSNRETVILRQMAGSSVEGDLETRTENRTGLPDYLKAGMESLSRWALDDVRVHYNSPKPAELHALAYTRGTEIHVAPGQERHLPHEAWHVVQQAQGRVKPMAQTKGGVQVNDDVALEKEADRMGQRVAANGIPGHQLRAMQSVSSGNHFSNASRVRISAENEERTTHRVTPARGTHVAQLCQFGHPEHADQEVCPYEGFGQFLFRDVFRLVANQTTGEDYLNLASLNHRTRAAITQGTELGQRYDRERHHHQRVQDAAAEGRRAGRRYRARRRRIQRQQRAGMWTLQEVNDALEILMRERKYTGYSNIPNW